VGRRHLIRIAVAAAISLVAAAPAGAAIHWRPLADGSAVGGPAAPATVAYLALDRAGTAQFSRRLPASARTKIGQVQFGRDALVAIFGEFGCRDHSVTVSSLDQAGTKLAVRLREEPPAPGTVACMAIFPTYRLLLVAKSQLQIPFPTYAGVTLARA
jgi:hypothetical protein